MWKGGEIIKKGKVFWLLLLIMTLTIITVSADITHPDHNSNFYLEYASGSTLCTDTSSAHSYWTYGNAHNTHSTRLAVYVLNASGTIMDSDTSTSYSTYASAWWTRSYETSHGHRAMSTLISR